MFRWKRLRKVKDGKETVFDRRRKSVIAHKSQTKEFQKLRLEKGWKRKQSTSWKGKGYQISGTEFLIKSVDFLEIEKVNSKILTP